jgi:hypothetical protein
VSVCILENEIVQPSRRGILLPTARPSGRFNYDKPLTGFKRGTTRLWVILIMAGKTLVFSGKLKRLYLFKTCKEQIFENILFLI